MGADTVTKSQAADTATHGHKGPPKPVIALVVLAALGGLGYYLAPRFMPAPPPSDRITVSGRIEGYETNVGPKVGGRVDFIGYREGETVKAGDVLVKIADDDIQAQLRSAQAKKLRAQENAEETRYQIEACQDQIAEAELRVTQSGEDTRAQTNQAEANVATAQARLSESEAQLTQSQADLQLANVRKGRYAFLVSKGAVTTDENDQAQANADSQAALVKSRASSVEAAKKQLHVAEAALDQARSTRLNPGMMRAQKSNLGKQLIQAKYRLKSAQQEMAAAKADEEQIQANIAYLTIKSPIDGIVTARVVEPGAVVVPGQTLLSLINLDTVYMRGYVPEGAIGKIRVGQEAKIVLDSSPDKPFTGQISQIDPEGSFTPENIYFKDDRVKQVFGIKIRINQPDRFAKPGMPADATIMLDGSINGADSGSPSTSAVNSAATAGK